MLMENNLAYNIDYSNVKYNRERYENIIFAWGCPECGRVHNYNLEQIEDIMICCDNRNPSDELVVCPSCRKIIQRIVYKPLKLLAREPGVCRDVYLMSDGDCLYIKDGNVICEV